MTLKKNALFTDLLLFGILIDTILIQGSFGFNIKPIFYLIIFLFFSDDLLRKINNKITNILTFIIFFLLLHLIILLSLNFGYQSDSNSISIFKYLLSYANLIIQIIIAFYIYISFKIEDYIQFITRLYHIIIFFLISHTLSYIFFIDSLLTSYEWLSALFAIIVFSYFMVKITVNFKINYLIGSVVSLSVILLTGLDSALLAILAIIIIIITNSFKNTLFAVKFFLFLFLFITLYFLSLYVIEIFSNNDSFLGIFVARAYILVRYLTILSEYYLLGVGFGLSEIYFNISELSYQNGYLWVEYIKSYNNSYLTEEVAKEHARFSDGVRKTSSHNSFLDILIEFGIIGFLSILYLGKELFFSLFSSKAKLMSNYQMLHMSNVILLGLTVFYFFLSMLQFTWIFLVFFAFFKRIKSDERRSIDAK